MRRHSFVGFCPFLYCCMPIPGRYRLFTRLGDVYNRKLRRTQIVEIVNINHANALLRPYMHDPAASTPAVSSEKKGRVSGRGPTGAKGGASGEARVKGKATKKK